MSARNYVHNSEHDDDYVEDPDPVTKISRLDISDPFHLHPNDSSALTVVLIKLKRTENYQVWSCAMLLALERKNKTGFIDGSCKRSNTDEILAKLWDRVNAVVLGWILNSISKELFLGHIFFKKGQNMFGKNFKKLMINSILSRKVLPDVRSSYATISSEESHKVASSNVSGSSQRSQVSAFVSNVPNKNNFHRNNQNSNYGPRPNNIHNNRQGGGSGLVCENYGFNGHTIDRCFKIIGYPADFEKKNFGQNQKNKGVSNNNYVGSSSSSCFLDEQMAT
ncbi:ribonuclease H-like domain-containing protein, partial [Tanacetum coccineum]